MHTRHVAYAASKIGHVGGLILTRPVVDDNKLAKHCGWQIIAITPRRASMGMRGFRVSQHYILNN